MAGSTGGTTRALRSLGARLRVHDLPEGVSIPIDAQFLDGMELSPWRTDAGDVDVLRGIPAESMAHLNRYPELIIAADAVEFAGCRLGRRGLSRRDRGRPRSGPVARTYRSSTGCFARP